MKKKFKVEIFRTAYALNAVEVEAETPNEAKERALETAGNADFTDCTYHVEYEAGDAEEVDEKEKEVENPYIDDKGDPYDSESDDCCWPAGGGLHKDCEFNADALYAYYKMLDRTKITAYLTSKGFTPLTQTENYEEWSKGNTLITFEGYDEPAKQWGYMHTELLSD